MRSWQREYDESVAFARGLMYAAVPSLLIWLIAFLVIAL